MLHLLLKHRGFKSIDLCADGKEAIDCVSLKDYDHYDIIFLDNLMPVMVSDDYFFFVFTFFNKTFQIFFLIFTVNSSIMSNIHYYIIIDMYRMDLKPYLFYVKTVSIN